MASLTYRPALDGLRAIAVVAVLIFHLNRAWLPGGFVGVDIFFVLSGYLITSILLAEALEGRLSYAKFYQRRIARIAPASFCVIAATLVAAMFIYNAQDTASTGAVAVSAAISAANMKLMLQGNYFQISADAQPLLHFWSLAVEEQFYLLLPALLHLCVKLDRRLRVLTTLLILTLLISFAACVGLTQMRPTWAFYLLPTRAWELVAGCLLAVAAITASKNVNSSWRSASGVVGLLLLVASFVLLTEGNHFPGYVAALPVVGTVLCIGSRHAVDTITERFLAHPFMVMIGKASYSLYLWHWPVYCFTDYGLYDWPESTRLAIKIVVTLLLSVASYFVVEVPARRSLNQPSHRRLAYALFVAMVIGGVVAGLAARREYFVNADLNQVRGGGISYPAGADSPRIVLVGDSNGSMYGRTMRKLCAERGWGLNVLSVAAGEPFADTPLHADTIAALRDIRPNVVVVGAAWSGKLSKDPQQIDRFVEELFEIADGVVLLTQPPILETDVNRNAIRNGKQPPYLEEAARAKLRADGNEHVRLLADSDGRLRLVSVEDLFTTEPGVIRFTDIAGRQLWQDATHLSGVGADMVTSRVDDAIQALMSRAEEPAKD